ADKINGNSSKIVSPHIIAGFLPVNSAGKRHLLDMYRAAKGRYQLPLGALRFILWRYSINSPSWTANEVQGIDYSSMLFGLASLPEYLGTNFFSTYNNFFDTMSVSIDQELEVELKLYPNPSSDHLMLELEGIEGYEFKIMDVQGKELKVNTTSFENSLRWDISSLTAGMYILQIRKGQAKTERKFLVP
ncbi:MAG: T9SS type A sorting domain-containing protein, partial [Bacteroidota bacterium]